MTTQQFDGIFCNHGPTDWQQTKQGALANVRLAVKDVFAIAGEKNSAGNPDWFAAAQPSKITASAVAKLMQQGCRFVGYTHTDELAYSLEGNNLHYGCAENPNAAGHACGGSSMGSAAAVAANLADIGLGTDTGGSIRVPASYCGLYGIRPSHDVIATDGLIPLAPCFDTVGWFARSPQHLMQVADVLLPQQEQVTLDTLVTCDQLFSLVNPDCAQLLNKQVKQLKPLFKHNQLFSLPKEDFFSKLADAFRVLQGRAIAKQHGHWLKTAQPRFAQAIAERFKMAMALTAQEEQQAKVVQQQWQTIMADNLSSTACLFLPTTPTTAPALGNGAHNLRQQILSLSAIAGLTQAVQVHLPSLRSEQGHPYGFSLMARKGNDRNLLNRVSVIANQINEDITND